MISGEAESQDIARRPIGIYIHVPFCRHLCPYCDFAKLKLDSTTQTLPRQFTHVVLEEAKRITAAHPELLARPVETIYFGGGTPSILEPRQLGNLISALATEVGLHVHAVETTIEVNPESLTDRKLRAWQRMGINRLSIGVQSFKYDELIRLGRGHAPELIVRGLKAVKEFRFHRVSLDLIFALPGQTAESLLYSIDEALRWDFGHLSFYGLTIKDDTPFAARAREGKFTLPDDGAQAALFDRAADRLEAAGYEHYEISSFARRGHRALHNARYWNGFDWIGLGPGAHSSLGALRWENPKDYARWESPLALAGSECLPRIEVHAPGPDQVRLERLYLGLRQREGLDLAAFAAATGTELRRDAVALLDGLVRDGLARAEALPARLALTRRGMLLCDEIVARLA